MEIVVNGRFTTQPLTGVQRYAQEICSRLADRVRLITPRRWTKGWKGHCWEQFGLPWQARGKLLWSPGNTGPAGFARQVVTIHDCAVFDRPGDFSGGFSGWYQRLLPKLAKRARRIITVSEFSRGRIAALFDVPESKITAIHCGVDGGFRPVEPDRAREVRQRLALPEKYILSVGTLEPRKNLRALLAAWQQIASRLPEHHLVMVGGKSDLFRNAGLDPLPERVMLTGRVADADLPAVYGLARMFVYPSLYEGFGLPVLEAMGCGTPVICSATTALPEAAGDAAVLINPESTEELGAAICDLAGDERRCQELSRRGRERSERFTWDRAAERTWQVLSDAAAEG